MGLSVLPAMLLMPPQCHRTLRLRCGIWYWNLPVGIVNDYFPFPIQYNFCSKMKDRYPSRQVPVQN